MKSSELAKNVQQVLLNSVELVSHDITLNTTEVTQSDWLQRFGRFFGPTTTSFWSRYRTVSFDSRMALNGLLANLRAQMPKGNRLQQAMLIRYFHQAMGELFGINRFGSMYFRSNADVLRLALVTVAALTLVAAVASLVAAVVVGLPSQAMVLPALLAAVSLCGMLMLRQKYHATGMFSRQAHHRERELYQWSGELRDADFVKNNQTTNLCVMNPNTVRNAVVAQLRSELPEPAHAVQPIL